MRHRALLFALLLTASLILLLVMRRSPTTDSGRESAAGPAGSVAESVPSNIVASVSAPPVVRGGPAGRPLPGEAILRGYASPALSAENDLTLMARLMENSLLLLKSAGNRPLSANEDWADLLRGRNAAHERYLPDQHIALNSRGQLIDRWGTPLFFHALGGARYEIRSAGPDRRLWTGDDVHRSPDGSFLHGEALQAWPRADR